LAELRTKIEFDHLSADHAERHVEIYRELREQHPVAWTDAYGGFWVVSRYSDVARIARDDETFSSDHDRGGINIPPAPARNTPLEVDPPEFLHYRALLNPPFAPAALAGWDAFVSDWTAHFIDLAIESGSIDFVRELGNPVPALFTLAFLGFPLDEWQRYAEPMHDAVACPPDTPGHHRAVEGIAWVQEQIRAALAERRARPQGDLLSRIANAQLDGRPIPEERAQETVFLIIGGGVDTTTALLSNALVWLNDQPGARAYLRDDPKRIATACEEFLRVFTPTQALARTAMRDVEVGGQRIREGERILISWASANRDAALFDRPDEVVLDRFPNRHAAFGLGQHRCLGSNFARLEFGILLREVLRRMPDYQIDLSRAERYASIGIVNGWVSLPARFTPGDRIGSARRGRSA
jgi:cytochrome P450